MNYWNYIKVEQLLALQGGFDEDETRVNDHEALFIVVHQVYELWFKLILRELTSARDIFRKNPVRDEQLSLSVRSFRRAIAIFEQAGHHFRVMETLTARDFLDFRDRLIPASGFQSAQLREIEILLGLQDNERIQFGHKGSWMEALKSARGESSPATRWVEARIADGPSLKHCLYEWLSQTPIHGSNEPAAVMRFLLEYIGSMDGTNTHRPARPVRLGTTGPPLESAGGGTARTRPPRSADDRRHVRRKAPRAAVPHVCHVRLRLRMPAARTAWRGRSLARRARARPCADGAAPRGVCVTARGSVPQTEAIREERIVGCIALVTRKPRH